MRESRIVIYALDETGAQVELLYSINGYVNNVLIDPPIGYYEARVISPISKNFDMFSAGTTSGTSQMGYGYLELANTDGGLDYLANYTLSDRFIASYFFDTDAPYSTTSGNVYGYIDNCVFALDKLTINIKDVSKILDVPILWETYGGTNVLPNGLDGTDDIKGQLKPIVYGKVFNVDPILVNTSKYIYQVSCNGDGNLINNVYDMGVPLTQATTTYASLVALEASAPAVGEYKVYSGTGGTYFRIGSLPAGAITCDVENYNKFGSSVGYNSIKNIVGRVIASISSKSFAGLLGSSVPFNYDAGIFINDSKTAFSTLYDILESISGFFIFDEFDSGYYYLGLLEDPSSLTPDFYYEKPDIISIERSVTNDVGKGVESWRQVISYAKNYTIQNDSDLAASVSNSRRNVLAREFSNEVYENSAIVLKNPISPEIQKNTLIVNQTDALTELNRLTNLYSVNRILYRIELAILDYSPLPKVSDIVNLTFDRFGLQSGKNFVVLGVLYDYPAMKFKLTLWG